MSFIFFFLSMRICEIIVIFVALKYVLAFFELEVDYINFITEKFSKINVGFEKIEFKDNSNAIFETLLNDNERKNSVIIEFIEFIKKKDFEGLWNYIINECDFDKILVFYIEFKYYHFWMILPFMLLLGYIFALHAFFGLYSVYVDYFQKNPDHFYSYRGFIPALCIFVYLCFLILSLIFFFSSTYLLYITWFLFI